LSDGRRIRLETARLGDLHLTVALEVDDDLEARLGAEEERSAARARALRYLETRERSSGEVIQRLRRYGYGEPLVGDTLEWLHGLGYVDDRRFAEWFARAQSRSAWGARRLREELRRKGVSRPIIEETVLAFSAATQGTGGGVEDLVAQVERRFSRELTTDRERAERRITGYLGRRGHDWETIRRVLAQLPLPTGLTDGGDK